MTDKAFWMVWNPMGDVPTVSHETKGSAELEARRIADLQPGVHVYVLQATDSFRRHEPVTHTKLNVEIPF